MKYEIFGNDLPGVSILLDKGESVYTQSGGMSWMSDKMKMETNVKGGLMKGIGRMFSGESLFMVTYTSMAAAQEHPLKCGMDQTFFIGIVWWRRLYPTTN